MSLLRARKQAAFLSTGLGHWTSHSVNLGQSVGEDSSSGDVLIRVLSYLSLWEKCISPIWGGGESEDGNPSLVKREWDLGNNSMYCDIEMKNH